MLLERGNLTLDRLRHIWFVIAEKARLAHALRSADLGR